MQTIVDVNSVEKGYGLTQVINHCSFKIYEELLILYIMFWRTE